ncbi:MAG: ribosome recycling factor [Dehalococcoidia bacterium]|nr:ribosome recycling factor [Dehalococcoidia bacterium]
MANEVLIDLNTKMEKTVEVLAREMATLRTGRATPALVEHVKVDYHGILTPLNQLASITVPEVNLIVIQPWERAICGNIEKAILKANLGFSPTNDGQVVRIIVPPLTEERRKELVKIVRKRAEEARVALRNQRRDAIEHLRQMEKDKLISKDQQARLTEQLQKLTDSFIEKVNRISADKEKEIAEA